MERLNEQPHGSPIACVGGVAELRSRAVAAVSAAGFQPRPCRPGEMQPDVAVLAVRSLTATAREIARCGSQHAGVPLLVFAAESRPEGVVNALRAGADGIVPLSTGADGVRRAVHALLRGENVVPRGDLSQLVDALRGTESPPQGRARLLSPRELLVLRRLAAGCSVADISTELCITPSAVRAYTSRGLVKLRTEDRDAALELVTASS